MKARGGNYENPCRYSYLYDHPSGDKEVRGGGGTNVSLNRFRYRSHYRFHYPLSILLELQKQYPGISLRLMNLSTASGVSMLASNPKRPLATVSWWHLVADQSLLASTDIGIRVVPSLGSAKDRLALKEGLRRGILTGVSVSGVALDDAETKKPISEKAPGLNGYQLVLPFLWQELKQFFAFFIVRYYMIFGWWHN